MGDTRKTNVEIFEDFRRRIKDDKLDVSSGIFVMSELHEKMMLHATSFANYIIKDGIVGQREDVVGNLCIEQSGILGCSKLTESIDGDLSLTNFVTVDEMYEKFIRR